MRIRNAKGVEVTDHSKHNDGWCQSDSHGEIVMGPDSSVSEGEVEFVCNTIGCNVRKWFRFDMINIREVK